MQNPWKWWHIQNHIVFSRKNTRLIDIGTGSTCQLLLLLTLAASKTSKLRLVFIRALNGTLTAVWNSGNHTTSLVQLRADCDCLLTADCWSTATKAREPQRRVSLHGRRPGSPPDSASGFGAMHGVACLVILKNRQELDATSMTRPQALEYCTMWCGVLSSWRIRKPCDIWHYLYVTCESIICYNDELSSMMSWVGYLLKAYYLFAENSKILFRISVIPILLTASRLNFHVSIW